MPNYDYVCATCGPFTAFAPMSAYKDPATCPTCGASSARAILSAPTLASMDGGRRRAHETNERAAHEPKTTRSHGLTHPSSKGGARRPTQAPTLHRPDGAKSFPTSRPWMLGR
ncbi:MAG: zinc ribbon domain-containing protein [Pseudomonadota bacterium]